MFEIMKNVISAGNYRLSEVQHKAKKLYALGDIDEAQLDELMLLAAAGASADAERPEVLQMLAALNGKIEELSERVAALEGASEGSGSAESWPAWTAWDGVSSNYQYGAVVSHSGKLWQSVYSGQNVWEPGVVGAQFWVEYSE